VALGQTLFFTLSGDKIFFMKLEQIKKMNIPKLPGCYRFFDIGGKIIYIGKAASLRDRVTSYWQKSTDHSPAKSSMMKHISKVDWLETDSEIEALLLESNLIKKFQPEYNVMLRDDKRFAYIKVSLEDEIPGVFITRKIDRAGKYFGPFVSATAMRETVKAIRKIWPFCTERKIKDKPCFYAQIGRCLGVCGGLVTKRDYMEKVVKPIILFLAGKKKRVISRQKEEINKREKELKREPDEDKKDRLMNELSYLKFQLGNMKNVLAHANILGLTDKYAADVVELAKLLGLTKVPARIEGYDISNIFGKEAVGSMVVFADGEPDKNEYRKFKIRIGQGFANDVGMLKEVLERRLAHYEIQNPKSPPRLASGEAGKIKNVKEWPLPDLVIIDGGKAQVNLAKRILKKHGLSMPVIAISKGDGLRSAVAPDKLFFAGERKPLQLPLASPAMHIIKRVRDEAHRFAIGYHRKLRRKKLFSV
jgi:excinuclease ABC subunit C